MPTLLKGTEIVQDTWQLVNDDAPLPETGNLILPLARWREAAEDIERSGRRAGAWVHGDSEPDELAEYLDRLPLIAIRFAAFNDGRGLSLATLLRTRFGFDGELRAIGAVHEDLVHYMLRCGFDSLLLGDDRNIDVARRGLNVMTHYYQGSVIEPRPAFRRLQRGR